MMLFTRALSSRRLSSHLARHLSSLGQPSGVPDDSDRADREFHEIPGPASLPFIKCLHNFLPGGRYSNLAEWQMLVQLHQEYGSIYKLEMPMQKSVVFVTSAEDFGRIFQADGKYPIRGEFEAYGHYRRAQGVGEGIAAAEGAKWKMYRELGQKVLGGPQSALLYLEQNNTAAELLIDNLLKKRTADGVVEDFCDIAKRWSFESMNLMALGKVIGIFENVEEASRLFTATLDLFEASTRLDRSLPLWKLLPSAEYGRLGTAIDVIWSACKRHVTEALQRPPAGSMMALMAGHVTDDRQRDLVVDIITDLLLSSIDTTSTTLTYLLHCLAVNPAEQLRARHELRQLLPDPDSPLQLTRPQLADMHYLKACLKEALRLHHVAAGVGRVLSQDVVLSGYRVPAGTKVVALSSLNALNPSNFPQPDRFLPERWLRSSQQYSKPAQWSYLPFGHGSRNCIGRRFAELEIWVTAAHLLHRFHIETRTPTFGVVMKLINLPDRPINLVFKDLKP